MSKVQLFVIAQANDESYPAKLQAKLAEFSDERRGQVDAFTRYVDTNAVVSMNMRPWKLRAFLNRGRYLSVQEAAEETAKQNGTSRDVELRSGQGAW